MKLNKTEILILTAMAQAYGPQTVSELYRALPPGLFSTKNVLSARLCEMRGRNLTNSVTLDSGINEWQATDGALRMLPDAIDGDISAVPEPAVSEPIQPDSPDIPPDISPDIVDDSDSIADTVATAMEEFNALGTPFCADLDPATSDDFNAALVEEANSLRLRRPLPREHDALYVLSVLIDILGRDSPAMAYELTRVAAYIEGEYA